MLRLPDFSVKTQYVRIGAISLAEGLEYIRQSRFLTRRKQTLFGVEVVFDGNRLATFLYKGTDCVNCENKGSYFAIERCRWENINTERFHPNLWGINRFGHHFMMTSDHIIPKSKNGSGRISNRQPMCVQCNNKKGDLLPAEYDLRKRRQQIRRETEALKKELGYERVV